MKPVVEVVWAEYVTINRMAEISGYSVSAIETKCRDGIWAEDKEWKWGPDGKRLISIAGYNAWCKRPGKRSNRGRRPIGEYLDDTARDHVWASQ